MIWQKMLYGTGALLLSTAILLAGSMEIGEAAKAESGIRYFMQAPKAKGSDTPYGNNTAAGHYAQAGDAKFTMRFMARASRFLSFMAVE